MLGSGNYKIKEIFQVCGNKSFVDKKHNNATSFLKDLVLLTFIHI